MIKTVLFLLPFFLSPILLQSQEPFWRQTNGPYGITVDKLVRDSSGYLYAFSMGRVYRSGDFEGSAWNQIPFASTIGRPFDLMITARGSFVLQSDSGIFRSTDRGDSWVQMDTEPYWVFTKSPGGVLYGAHLGRVLTSNDDGVSWLSLADSFFAANTSIFQIALNPAGHIFANTYDWITNTQLLFRSLDDGTTWVAVFPRGNLFGISADGNCYVSITNSYGAWTRIVRSTDNGDTWTTPSSPIDGALMQPTSFLTISDGNDYFASRRGVFHSTNHGDLWMSTSDGIPSNLDFYGWSQPVNALVTSRSGNLIAGTVGGTFRKAPTDSDWEWSSNGLGFASAEAIGVGPAGDVYVAGKNGMFRSDDHGESWSYLRNDSSAISFPEIAISPLTGTILVREQYDLLRSTDRGQTWTRLWPDFWEFRSVTAGPDGAFYLNAMGFDRYGHIFRSDDDGQTWQSVYIGVRNYAGLKVVCSRIGVLLAQMGSDTLLISVNGGQDWRGVLLPVMRQPVRSMTTTKSGAVIVGTESEIYRSTDWGVNWMLTMPHADTRILRSLQMDRSGNLFAYFTAGGIIQSSDDGKTWSEFGPRFSPGYFSSIAIDSSGYLYLASGNPWNSDGGGLYRTAMPIVTPVTELNDTRPATLAVYQNYPNPFNPTTTIRFDVPHDAMVRVRILNVLGQEVLTLVNEKKPPGVHLVSWNAGADDASGIYFCDVKVDPATHSIERLHRTVKMLLLK